MSRPIIVIENCAKPRKMNNSEYQMVTKYITKMLNDFYLDDLHFEAESHFGFTFEDGIIQCTNEAELPTGEENIPEDWVKQIYLTENGYLVVALLDEEERETLVQLASYEELLEGSKCPKL